MPLHDWADRLSWEGVHHLWIAETLRWVKLRLPQGYRAYIGTAPTLAVGAGGGKPDVGVHRGNGTVSPSTHAAADNPDLEVAVAAIDPATALMVERDGRLIAAVELVSPRNKDWPTSRATYAARYIGYLIEGVNLMLVDVHPRPAGFSYFSAIDQELSADLLGPAPPAAVSYRVGERAASGGRLLAVWRRPVAVGQPLPTLPLAITVHDSVTVDLEATYARAAADAYLD
jgi:hypothetical protein